MYEKQINTIDQTSNLVSHTLATVARLSESVLVSIVLLIAMVPEVLGVGKAQGYAVGITAGTVSLVTAKLALSDRGTQIAGYTIYFGWPLYALNMVASIYLIIATGMYEHLGYLVISLCGAVSSTRAAEIIKTDAANRLEEARQYRITNAIEEAKAKAQIEKLELRTDLQKEQMQLKHEAKWGVVVIDAPQVEDKSKCMENDGSKPAVTVDKLAENRQKAKVTVSKRVQERRDKVAKLLKSEPTLSNSQIAKLVGVKSASTISSDRKALGV